MTLGRWERGDTEPIAVYQRELARVLGVTASPDTVQQRIDWDLLPKAFERLEKAVTAVEKEVTTEVELSPAVIAAIDFAVQRLQGARLQAESSLGHED